MKSMNRRGLLQGSLALTLLIPGALSGCAGLGFDALPPEVTLLNLRPLKPEGLEQRFEVDLRFTNPNDFDLVFSGFNFALDVNEAKVASGVSDQALTLPRLGEAKTTVVASTSLLELLKQIMGVMEEGKLDYRISGLAYLTGPITQRVPYETSGKLEITPGSNPLEGLVPI